MNGNDNYDTFNLENALGYNLNFFFATAYQNNTVNGVNLTIHNCNTLASSPDSTTTGFLTNSLLVSVTNMIPGSWSVDSTARLTTDAGIFLTVGAGSHYLQASNCAAQLHNTGTTNISPALLARLSQKTTYPPAVLTNNFTTNTTLSPIVPRDDDGLPDLGFHYDPIDFAWSGISLTSATLTLTNGVAVAGYGAKGITLQNGAKFISGGDPIHLNRLTRYNSVQEQANTNWMASSTATLGLLDLPSIQPATPPEIQLRFTDLTILAGTTIRRFLYNNYAGGTPGVLSSEHCQWRGLYLDGRCYSINGMTVSLTNNIIQRSWLSFGQQPSQQYYDYSLNCYNNLFLRGTEGFGYNDTGTTWTVKDNLFDCDGISGGTYSFSADYNGYRSGLTSLGGTHNKTITK